MTSTSKTGELAEGRSSGVTGNTRLPYIPGLDGLRALAVIAVIAYHSEIESVPGGFLGVEIFFVISGYLITALLLEEFNSNQRIDLKQFWARRARRLLPALFLYVAGSIALAYSMAEDVIPTKGEIISTLGYVYNWFGIFQEISYTDVFERKNFFHHLWSLAVEEQFYLLWPVLVLCLQKYLSKRTTIILISLGIATSTVLMWVMYQPFEDPLRLYYGTDTRASALLIGALLAYMWRPFNAQETKLYALAKKILFPVGFGAVAVLIWANMYYTLLMPDSEQLFRGGFLLTSIITAIVLASIVTPGSKLSNVLGFAPLVWIGKRSYGLYLWHWPVFQLTRERVDVDINGWELFAVRMFVTLILVEISYQYIERPIRERRMNLELSKFKNIGELKSHLLKLAFLTAGIIGSVLILQGVQSDRNFEGDLEVNKADSLKIETTEINPIETPSNTIDQVTSPTPAPISVLQPTETAFDANSNSKENDDLVVQEENPEEFRHQNFSEVDFQEAVMSEPEYWQDLVDITSYSPSIYFERITFIGDSVMLGALTNVANDGVEEAFLQGISTISEQVTVSAAKNRQWFELRGVIRELEANGEIGEVVVVHLGNNGVIDESIVNDSLELLEDVRKVLLVNVRVPRRWENKVNTLLDGAVEEFENTELVDWYSISNSNPQYFSRDGVHTIPSGARHYVDAIITTLGGESVLGNSDN